MLGHKVLLAALFTLTGMCLTLVLAPIMAEIAYLVAAKERRHAGVFGPRGAYAQAYGLFNMSFAGGTLVGPLWGGLIETRAGWKTLTWTLALLSGVSAVPSVGFFFLFFHLCILCSLFFFCSSHLSNFFFRNKGGWKGGIHLIYVYD